MAAPELNKLKLSIVIPCYNCKDTIGRLLDSILDNKLKQEEYEVIICDDKSTDGFLDIVKGYEDRMNIIYCTTTRDVHCPGNTRQAALPYIKGEWFTFIDNDDMFEPNAFSQAFYYIDKINIKYTLVTNFREYFYEEQKYGREICGDETDTWLHGKYFNREKTLDEFKCYFKEDLMSHEDLFFNSSNLAKLIAMGEDYIYVPVFTYKWIYNPTSLSRSYFSKKDYYIDTYLEDFMIGSSEPFFSMANWFKGKDNEKYSFAINQIMMTLLHGYFYYEASEWRLGNNDTLIDSWVALKKFKRRIIDEIGMNDNDIVNYIYNLPERYIKIKQQCFSGTCPFVEVHSFKDFIYYL